MEGIKIVECLEQWGWTDPDNWKPLWTTLLEASSSSRVVAAKKGAEDSASAKKQF